MSVPSSRLPRSRVVRKQPRGSCRPRFRLVGPSQCQSNWYVNFLFSPSRSPSPITTLPHPHSARKRPRGAASRDFDWLVNRNANQTGMLISSFPSISHHPPPASPLRSKTTSWHSPAQILIHWGRGGLETDKNILSTLQALVESTCHLPTNNRLGTFQMFLQVPG